MSEQPSDNFKDINVSSTWKNKFELIEKIGADKVFIYSATKSDAFRKLSFKEMFQVGFNFYAFVFQYLYYLQKNMWLKGLVILGGLFIINSIFLLIESMAKIHLPVSVYWVVGASICSSLANYDYYRSVVKKEKMWEKLHSFSKPLYLVIFLFSSIALFVFVSYLYVYKDSSHNESRCMDAKITSFVIELAETQVIKKIGTEAAKVFVYKISEIKSVNLNHENKTEECAANLLINSKTGDHDLTPITYKIEDVNSGKDAYVTVFFGK